MAALLGGALMRLFSRSSSATQTRAAAAAAASVPAASERTSYGTALPPVVHATLASTFDPANSGSGSSSNAGAARPLRPGGRVVVVGDVHACAAELEALLRAAAFVEGADNLVLVGDLVGKGPSPREVIAIARRCGAHAVAGNHCHAAIAAADAWLSGATTADARHPGPKHAWVADVPPGARDADVDYLRELPFTLALPEYGAVVVHAGLIPGSVRVDAGGLGGGESGGKGVGESGGSSSGTAPAINIAPLGADGVEPLFKMRDLARGGGGGGAWEWYEKAPEGVAARAWAKEWDGPVHVFFGHDAKRRLQTERAATGLDTGCVYGGSLTAAVLPPLGALPAAARVKIAAGEAPALGDYGARLVSVNALREWAPKDKGKGKDKAGEGGEAGAGGGVEANIGSSSTGGGGGKKDKAKGHAKKK